MAGEAENRGDPGKFSLEAWFLEVFFDLRGRMGDFGFGPGEFLDYLESRAGAAGVRKIAGPRLEDFFLGLGLLLGSGRAFRFLERQYALRFFQAASRAGFPGEDARDALQETLAVLWRDPARKTRSPLEGYRGRGSLYGFLLTVFLRKLARRGAARSRISRLEEADRIPHPSPDPGSRAAAREARAIFRDLVGGALDSLPPATRAFLLAVHVEGRPATKAAVRIGLLPPGASHLRTLASRLHARAMAAFRKALLERAREIYGMGGDQLQALLGREPLHFHRKGHQKEGGAGGAG